MGGVSGPGVEAICSRIAGMNDETGAKIGGDIVEASVVANAVVGA
jgi:hypothetical protein